MTTAYLSEKQIRKRKRIFKIKIYGIAILLFALVIGFLYLVAYSPIFKISEFQIIFDDKINDKNFTQADKIAADFKIFLLGRSRLNSILGENNIISWTGDLGIKEFLNENPPIGDLFVQKDYLLRKIIFEIKNREKFGIWCAEILKEIDLPAEKKCWWFDKSGIVFEQAPKIDGEMIYRVVDFSEKKLAIGGLVLDKNLMVNLLKIFGVLDNSGLNIRTLYLKDLALQEVLVEPANALMPKIYFSLRFDPSFTLPVIESLKKTGLNKIDYMDFRAENRAYYKLK